MDINSILLAILAIIGGISVALVTYYLTVRHERASQRSKITGWLRWLAIFLGQIHGHHIDMMEAEGKLPWWADHMLQSAADAFISLSPHENELLNSLISEAWTDDIWRFSEGNLLQKQKLQFDFEKVSKIAEHVGTLITILSKKDS